MSTRRKIGLLVLPAALALAIALVVWLNLFGSKPLSGLSTAGERRVEAVIIQKDGLNFSPTPTAIVRDPANLERLVGRAQQVQVWARKIVGDEPDKNGTMQITFQHADGSETTVGFWNGLVAGPDAYVCDFTTGSALWLEAACLLDSYTGTAMLEYPYRYLIDMGVTKAAVTDRQTGRSVELTPAQLDLLKDAPILVEGGACQPAGDCRYAITLELQNGFTFETTANEFGFRLNESCYTWRAPAEDGFSVTYSAFQAFCEQALAQ